MSALSAAAIAAVLGLRPSNDGRNLVEADSTDAAPDAGASDSSLRQALTPIVAQIAAGELSEDEGLTALIEAFKAPSAVLEAASNRKALESVRDEDARKRGARLLLEALAPSNVSVTSSMVNITSAVRSEEGRRAKARELIATEQERLRRRARPSKGVVDAGEAMAILHHNG